MDNFDSAYNIDRQGRSQTLFDGRAHYFYNTPSYQHADSYVHLLTVVVWKVHSMISYS